MNAAERTAQAKAHGWAWGPRPTSAQRARMAPFYLPDQSDEGVFEGRWEGVPFLAAEMSVGGSGVVNAVVVPMPFAAPAFVVVPQALSRLARIDHPFGTAGKDIDFESDAFSRAYWVSCADRRFAYAVLHPAAIESLLADRPQGALVWHGNVMALTFQGEGAFSSITPETLQQALRILVGFRKTLPRSLDGKSGQQPKAEEFEALKAPFQRRKRRALRVLFASLAAIAVGVVVSLAVEGPIEGALGGAVAISIFGGVIGFLTGGVMLANAAYAKDKGMFDLARQAGRPR